MQTINFYIIIVVGVIAAAGASIKDKQYVVSAFLGIVLAFASVLFFLMDRRARILVRIGEAALRIEEAALAGEVGNSSIQLIAASARSGEESLTYGKIFYTMFWTLFVVGILMTIASTFAYLILPASDTKEPIKLLIDFRSILPHQL